MKNNQTIKEAILVYMNEQDQMAFKVKELSEGMKLTSSVDFKMLVSTLADIEREGTVFLNKKGEFKLAEKAGVLSGIFRASDRGFGFVSIEDEENDIYIPNNQTNFALDGDIVTIEITRPAEPWFDKGAEGRVKAIIERKFTQLVGEFFAYTQEGVDETGLYGYIEPKDKKLTDFRVFIEEKGIKPVDGAIVLVELTLYPDKEFPRSMQGIVKSIVGHKNDPGIDILTIVYKHGIQIEFPEEVMAQANEVPDKITEKDMENRRDLRDEIVVTIDGEDAKDLDDAVTVKKLANGHFKLGVHIADVSYYVTEDSPLDKEAFDRATSVYLTDRVIPMLPHRLSNGICSLNPNEDRLAMSCEMEIDSTGKVVNHDVFQSVIRSYRRMSYTQVNQIIMDTDEAVRKENADLIPMFENMADLHKILEASRKTRGAIDFESPEAKIIVDSQGHPLDIVLRERGIGERIIESFMLAANETVSEHFTRLKVPMIYRVHEQPDSDRMQKFMEFVTAFGISVKGLSENISPKSLQKVLRSVAGKPEETVISTMLLRSMKQAKYDVEPLGHYGLAADYYSHFTSPIRRYPDLILHRLIRSYSENGTESDQKDKWNSLLPEIAIQSSKMERRAVDAERETDALKKTEYMVDKVGETFTGIIGSVLRFGLFIELPNTVEGLVHISNMKDDYYNYVEEQLLLVGERTGVVYRIGQKVKIKVTKANPETREIDFELIPDPDAPKADSFTQLKKSDDKDKKKSGNRKPDRQKQSKGPLNKKTSYPAKDSKNTNSTDKKKNKPFYKDVAKKGKPKKKRS
ncbi:RNAse R [Carnobacterium iners]|uniref:Ribonuclease R n=1 Tax=Carnobacterium iners TaxID=1073423 RepID=A0A1X7MQY6_9LACT|nr:ribonuclease R [Carnobacterium iners]SEL29897.1 RNAse R [Carnobacterium iners]SMH26751.1 RNAse R [Carnobacterium iners]